LLDGKDNVLWGLGFLFVEIVNAQHESYNQGPSESSKWSVDRERKFHGQEVSLLL